MLGDYTTVFPQACAGPLEGTAVLGIPSSTVAFACVGEAPRLFLRLVDVVDPIHCGSWDRSPSGQIILRHGGVSANSLAIVTPR